MNEPYSITMSCIRRKLSFLLMKSIITCICGSKTFKMNKEKQCTSELMGHTLREKCPNTEFFLVHIFPYSDYRNAGKYGLEKTPYLDFFYAVIAKQDVSRVNNWSTLTVTY